MIRNQHASLLKSLIDDYYHDQLSFDEYRSQRRALLDQIDQQWNGVMPGKKQATKHRDYAGEQHEEPTTPTIPTYVGERRSRPRNDGEA